MRTLLGPGAIGETVRQVQVALVQDGCTLAPDRIYGAGTCIAIKQFQTRNSQEPTGIVDDVTWQALLRCAVPPMSERCLNLTAAFEGHGFELAMGDFDGAMLTWGIIGFTLKSGQVQKIIDAIESTHPDCLQTAFGSYCDELLQLVANNADAQKAWASAHTLKNGTLTEPWRTMFANFGAMPEIQAVQIACAEQDYFQPAIQTANSLGFTSELGLALCFDIHVQNGGVHSGAMQSYRQQSAASTPELDRRRLLANLVADLQSGQWKDDVRVRKLTVATGQGVVHGHNYLLDNWGLSGEIVARELAPTSNASNVMQNVAPASG